MEECKDFSRELSNDSPIFNLHSQPQKHIDKDVKKVNECDLNRQSSEAIDLNELSDKDYSDLIEDSQQMYNQHHDCKSLSKCRRLNKFNFYSRKISFF